MLKPRRLAPLALLGLLALATQASAQTIPAGAGTLDGGDRLRVPGCGRQGGPVSVDFALAADGAWTAAAGDETYSGSSTQLTPRLARLTLDAESAAELQDELASEASELCEQEVTIGALRHVAALKVSKRGDRARLHLRARAFGSGASGERGPGLYRLRAGGAWTPAAS
jgi:hypothetical protein